MFLRDHPAIKGNGKLDAFRADWRLLKVDPLNDLRDLSAPENRAHIEALKANIREFGVKDPLEIRYDGTDIFVTDGKCRLTALAELRTEGFDEIDTVVTIPERRGLDDAERTAGILVASTLTKNYDRLEVGVGIKRLLDFGWSPEKIAKRMGWKSVATVEHHLQFNELPAAAKEAVSAGTVSATAARKLVERHGEAAPAILQQATETAKARVGDGETVKVKPRDIRAVEPKPEQQRAAQDPIAANGAAPDNGPEIDISSEPASERAKTVLQDLIAAIRPIARAALAADAADVRLDNAALTILIKAGELKAVLNAWYRATRGATP